MERFEASTIGLGEGAGRKLTGLYWAMAGGKTIHRTLNCNNGKWDQAKAMKVPAYEEDGQLYYEHGDLRHQAKVCRSCDFEPAPEDWKERAACRDMFEERFFSEVKVERDAAIAELCAPCPVTLACLEYGQVRETENVGAVWGGVYFSPNRQERRKQIERQADSLR